MRLSWFAIVLPWVIAASAHAEPLDQRTIPADAKWLVHIDLDALIAAEVFQPIRKDLLSRPDVQADIAKVRAAIGTDPTQDVHSITLFGRAYTGNSVVIVVRAKSNPEKVLTHLRDKRPDYKVTPYGGHQLYTWTEGTGSQNETSLTGCFHKPTVVVFGREAAEVKRALEILDGKSATLADSGSLLAADAPEGTILQVRAMDLANVPDDFKSPLIRLTELLSLAAGEHRGEVFVRASVTAKTSQTAGDMRDWLRGAVGMARIQVKNDEEVMEILDALEMTLADRTLTLQWRGTSKDVMKLIEKVQAKQAQTIRTD